LSFGPERLREARSGAIHEAQNKLRPMVFVYNPVPDGTVQRSDPRLTVFIRQGHTALHLLDIHNWMPIVGILECPSQVAGERFPDSGLA
jgi:hypothetical protein